MKWLKTIGKGLLGIGSNDAVGNVLNKGMDIWDSSSFTPQERVGAFAKIAKIMSSKETALSRRILLWAVLGVNVTAFVIGCICIFMGWTDELELLIWLVQTLYFGQALVAAVGFYYLAHIVNGGKK